MAIRLDSSSRTTVARNPERSRERILNAAFKEFAAKGFAGARVDQIARRAGINKRMLYHYFGDKESLFRHVLRRKMAERKTWGIATPDEPAESLPYWFDLACKDLDWIRLLEWEALQFLDKSLIDEERRGAATADAVARIARRQKLGFLDNTFSPEQILLAMVGLTWFPVAFPQLTRLVTGQSPFNQDFQTAQREFLRRFAQAFSKNDHRKTAQNGSRRNGHAKEVK